MLRSIVTKLALSLALLVGVTMSASPALAATNPFGGVNCAKASDTAICQTPTSGDPVTGPNGIIHSVTRIIALLAGTAAVIIMVVAGIRYITSGGDAEQTKRSKNAIISAAIGLIVIVAGQALINLVISRI